MTKLFFNGPKGAYDIETHFDRAVSLCFFGDLRRRMFESRQIGMSLRRQPQKNIKQEDSVLRDRSNGRLFFCIY